MRIIFSAFIFLALGASTAFADCKKKEICAMIGKLNHFAILDKCPNAGPLLAECKKVSDKEIEELPEPKFVDNGDGTVSDTVNKLLWIKKGILEKKSLKDAKRLAMTSNEGGRKGWRLPTLPELKTLIYKERVINAGGKKAWIHPVFDDGLGHYYWTTTTCSEVSNITDRYQRKICQQGDTAAWLVHFNINAIFWHHTAAQNYFVWLVQNQE